MQAAILFLVKCLIVSGILFTYYLLVLRNRKLYQYNRFFLLGILAVSLVIPLLHFEWYQIAPARSGNYRILQAISENSNDEMPIAAGNGLTIYDVMKYSYLGVCLILLVMFIIKLFRLRKLKKAHLQERIDSITIVHTRIETAPFSFFNILFWKDTISFDSEEGKLILQHERAHIRQKHTYDKLFVQLVLILCWLNPVFWLVRKELSLVHEYIADEAAINDSDTEAFARMLLQTNYPGYLNQIVHPFFYSPIKQRLIMLTTTNKTNYSYVRKLLVLPLLCASLFLFSFSFKNNTTVNKAKKEIVMVLDAGHGGTDAGVTGINGTPEKDLTLRITNKMSELASAYNIKVVLTRNGDEYPTLDQRVQMVKATAADLLVSIHVNDRQEKGTGYEVIVGRGSTKKAESVELASAISSKLQEIHIQSRLVEKGVHVLKTADVPAVLIECGYINDVKEMAMVDNDAELEKLCRNILSGVVNFESNKR